MGRFVPRSGAEVEIRALMDPFLRELGARTERKAKQNLRQAKIGDTGKLERSVKAGPVLADVSSSTIIIRAVRFNEAADVGTIIELGHKKIHPKKETGFLVFTTKDGAKIRTKEVRAVGGVQYLFRALNEAANELRGETGGKVWFKVTPLSTPVVAPLPHTIKPPTATITTRRRRR